MTTIWTVSQCGLWATHQ